MASLPEGDSRHRFDPSRFSSSGFEPRPMCLADEMHLVGGGNLDERSSPPEQLQDIDTNREVGSDVQLLIKGIEAFLRKV